MRGIATFAARGRVATPLLVGKLLGGPAEIPQTISSVGSNWPLGRRPSCPARNVGLRPAGSCRLGWRAGAVAGRALGVVAPAVHGLISSASRRSRFSIRCVRERSDSIAFSVRWSARGSPVDGCSRRSNCSSRCSRARLWTSSRCQSRLASFTTRCVHSSSIRHARRSARWSASMSRSI